MRKRINDIIGQRYGKLTVEKYSHKDSSSRNYFTCICSCGKSKTIQQSNLLSGRISSCGCIRRVDLIQDIEQVESSSHIQSNYQSANAKLDISTLQIIRRNKKIDDSILDNLNLSDPLVLKEPVFLNKGDRVVIKKSGMIGTSNKFANLSGFDVTLDDGGIVMVESINDVWLLIRYNDEHKIDFNK